MLWRISEKVAIRYLKTKCNGLIISTLCNRNEKRRKMLSDTKILFCGPSLDSPFKLTVVIVAVRGKCYYQP